MISMQVGLGSDRLLELVDHGFGRPGGELLLELDAEGLGSLSSTGLARQGGAIAGVAAHLHVHGEAGADQFIGGRGARDPLGNDGQHGCSQQGLNPFHLHVLPLKRVILAMNAARRCGSST